MIINVEIMKKILENVPDDFEIYFENTPIHDKLEINVSDRKLVLKSGY